MPGGKPGELLIFFFLIFFLVASFLSPARCVNFDPGYRLPFTTEAISSMEGTVIDLTELPMPDDAPDLLKNAPDFAIESDGCGMLTDDHASLIITFSRPEIRQQLRQLENLVAKNAAGYQKNRELACFKMPELLKDISTKELELCCKLWQQSIVIGVEHVTTHGEPTFFTGDLPVVDPDLLSPSRNFLKLQQIGKLLLINSQASMYIINGTTPSSTTTATTAASDIAPSDGAASSNVATEKPLREQILDHLKVAYEIFQGSNGDASNPVAVLLNDGHGIHFSCLVTLDGRFWILVDSTGSVFPPEPDMHEGLARRFLRMLYGHPPQHERSYLEPWQNWCMTSQCKVTREHDSVRYKQVDSISCLLTSLAFVYYQVSANFEGFPFVRRPLTQIYLTILDRTRYFCVLFPYIQAELKARMTPTSTGNGEK